jgi:hypothetical protein
MSTGRAYAKVFSEIVTFHTIGVSHRGYLFQTGTSQRSQKMLTKIGDYDRNEVGMPKPIITTLEETTPWCRKDWNRLDLHQPDWWTTCQQDKSSDKK